MYKKAIDLLIGMGNVEKEKLAVELAKHHPSIFIKLVEGKGKEEEAMLDNNIVFIISALNTGRRVDAIKGIRDYFGHGFKGSLDIIKVYNGDEDTLLTRDQTSTLDCLKDASKMLKFAALGH